MPGTANQRSAISYRICTNGMPASPGPADSANFSSSSASPGRAARAVHLGVRGLAPKLRVLRVDLAREDALLVELLRLVAHDEHDLVVRVDALVVVVVVLWRRDAVSGEHHGAAHLIARGEIEGHEIVAENELDMPAICRVCEAVVLAQLGVGGDAEGLVVTLAVSRLEAERAELGGDKGGGLLQLGRAGAAPFQILGRQELHVVHKAIGID